VRHIRCLIQFTGNSQITNLYFVFSAKEHVDSLYISVQDPVSVQVLNTKTHFDEKLPNLAFPEMLAHLSLQVLSQVLVLANLHDDVELVAGLKRVVKVNNVFIV